MATNRTYDQIQVGDTATRSRICTANDLFVFAHASGNINPLHLPNAEWEGEKTGEGPSAPFMWGGTLISAVIGNVLPGPGTVYRDQTLKFHSKVKVDQVLDVTVTVLEKMPERHVRLSTVVKLDDGTLVAEGEAVVIAPDNTISYDPEKLPSLLMKRHQHFDRLVALAKQLPAIPTSVVCPDDANSLGGTVLAAEAGLIVPILCGPAARIQAAAEKIGVDISSYELIDCEDENASASRAVALVHEGRVRSVMKGHLHTDDLLRHVVKREGGLRTKRRISHAFVMDVPGRSTPVIISDAAINIAPDLPTKVDITQNAINVARSIGIEPPKVGILSALETVNPAIPSTIDAAVLSKMADRGQIKGGIVDGPLAMDNAIDLEAARTKGIDSLVAGRAEVLIVPNLEAGNMIAKELTFVAHAETAGLVVGARVPVILTSRADNDRARLVSCALASMYDYYNLNKVAFTGEKSAEAAE
ncbi:MULTISPECIES: bifunctional enoyl-CoA hydratase/phosphate acetyltransferase [Pseudovibrio]|uniref:bifunctional enoyl-CoA hydratase/phosphate acetyltransferase n=1 Tax=Stappiaceae TaxID=2821832 RepID=UPI0023667E46|nr:MULTISPECIES: bifunctional enoyl-CoA hydratase/phosphate acetyltransferase [Pseudovibrio]MDD7910102.1 bifunctional enoyl-CoA hydratase/phosphate acetyltransferase [Pseudovibrio exalbescens]MDX5592385.1 bifunctional enoyl-CoA hydratase/phosphate acetyltransferase [Pseudovibrio sp. SPO723]